MAKVRVMFVLLQLDAGGSEKMVLDIAEKLHADHYEVYLASFGGGVLEGQFRKIATQVFIIKKQKRIDWAAMSVLAEIVKENRIQIVNAHHYMPMFYCFYGTRIMNRVKLIYTEHSVPEVEDIAESVHGKIFNLMLYQINAVVGVSREIVEKFRVRYPRHAKKFQAVLNGVDIERFRSEKGRDATRMRWGLSSDHFVVGMVANFRRVKNHACLLRAAAHLKSRAPQVRVVLVGAGFPGDPQNSEGEVRRLVDHLGLESRVTFAGYQENIPAVLQAFDAFCLPSVSEGMPMSVLEAMAAGVPVIGSEVRGNRELIRHRVNGLLFPKDDDRQLADCIHELAASPGIGRELASTAFRFVSEHHNEAAWIEQYRECFRPL